MEKTLKLALNKYHTIPHKLRADPKINKATESISVGLASLYHHYYLDSYGRVPPSPDPSQFEHIQFLLPGPDFRFQGSGLGISPAIKRHRSNELGQAFCRWFLHDHFNITYFAHLEHLINRQLHRAFNGFQIKRSASGDTPDYLCARDVDRVFLAEAKGRYSPISFKNKEFNDWRRQFNRVTFFDSKGVPRIIKGHIVATRFVTENHSDKVMSSIWAEDPESPGIEPPSPQSSREIARAIISSHYSNIATKLGQPLLASALSSGVVLPREINLLTVAWRVNMGPLQGRRFIGGYFGDGQISEINKRITVSHVDPFRLDNPSLTFFGVEESIFRQVVALAREGNDAIYQIAPFEETAFFYSGFSVLRDGSVLAPVEFFSPDEQLLL